MFVYAAKIGAIELFGETGDFALDEYAGIGFLVEEFDADGDDGAGYEEDPEDPAPADALGYET